MDIFSGLPPQPAEDAWRFTRALQAPLWTDHRWSSREPRSDEVVLGNGVRLVRGFPDPDGQLETAYEDLVSFLGAGGVSIDGNFEIETVSRGGAVTESFRIETGPGGCRILAGDTEGIRRGIFLLEDLMRRAGGPFLPLGTSERRPCVDRRISRCFFGPIKRPPKMRDELMDDVDYYPDQYLNRLAHEGVNGLWLTVEFRTVCRTSITPVDEHAERRLAKLRRTVDKCRRYGIRTYVFCIEPRAWDADSPIPAQYPELSGAAAYGNRTFFCPTTELAQRYLYESVNGLFADVPNLGGLINITHGERPTTCLSEISAVGVGNVNCPRCKNKTPWEILHASLSAMERGMHDAAPGADLISWLYMPQETGPFKADLADWVYEIPKHTPPGVILQFNFETGVTRDFFGKTVIGGDYWISAPGPSDRFERIATAARGAGTPMSAKIQAGCSHEVATAPFVPVPGLLYRKFAGMRRLGVRSTMLCWYFGNYPGLMNKTAGELSFEPFPEDEDVFLLQLAELDWGDHAEAAARAWRRFAEGYENYPLANAFQYYGPMHDGPVWPLLLEPKDAQLSPTWLLGSTTTLEPWPPSGDRVGEALAPAYTLVQGIELCRRVSGAWAEGVAILKEIEPSVGEDRERVLDIGVAEALGIQFRSGYNILRFYDWRETLFRSDDLTERLELLEKMAEVARDELANDKRLLTLCERDSRLGFHSEAEGYKYFPAKILWRMDQLEALLTEDFPELEQAIRNGDSLYPEYTGQCPRGPTVTCPIVPEVRAAWSDVTQPFPATLDYRTCVPTDGSDPGPRKTTWSLGRDRDALYLLFHCREPEPARLRSVPSDDFALATMYGRDVILLKLEPRRLWPCRRFAASAQGGRSVDETFAVRTALGYGGWQGVMRIPFDSIGRTPHRAWPIRIDVQRFTPGHSVQSWMPQHPWTLRLRLGSDNPADLGWVLWDQPG